MKISIRALLIIPVLVLAIIAGLIIKKITVSEEARIKNVISKLEQSAEKRQLASCMRCISDDYHDESGNTKETLYLYGREVFKNYEEILVHIRGLKIEVKGSQASAVFVATVLASSVKGSPGEDLLRGSDRFLLELKKDDGRWLITSSRQPEYTFE